MVRKVYVGNLPFSFTEEALKELFTPFGAVESVKIVVDAFSGRSKGFGFVEMTTEEEASTAVEKLNGVQIENRSIRVDLARPKEARPSNGGGRKPRSNGGGRRFDRGGGSSEGHNRW
jgi:RNA recognition motif-containing protein